MPNVRSFTGHKVHKIDAKSRVSIPAGMRSDLGNEFYITLGTDSCLTIYSLEGWDEFMERIHKLPETIKKKAEFRFVANAEIVSLDSNGRIILSEYLRKKGNLEGEKELVVYGATDRIELWNKAMFYERLDQCEEIDWGATFDSCGV